MKRKDTKVHGRASMSNPGRQRRVTVHPVPTPLSTIPLVNSKVREGGSIQNLILFIRGKAISGAPNIRGTSQLPNPPIIIGITIKKNYHESMGCYNYVINLIITDKPSGLTKFDTNNKSQGSTYYTCSRAK